MPFDSRHFPQPLPMDVFSMHHLQHQLTNLMPASVVVAGNPNVDAVRGCQLLGGGIMVLAALAPDTVVRHGREHLTALAHDDINVIMQIDGAASITADGSVFKVNGGDVLFQAAGRPSSCHAVTACRMLVLRLPFGRFRGNQGDKFEDVRATASHDASPLRDAAWQYVQQVLPALASSTMQTVMHAEQAFISLLAALHAQTRQRPAVLPPNRGDQLALALDAMATDPGLTVAALGAALGLSPRRVHALLAARGEKFGALLLARRLDLAQAALRLPHNADVGVAQIGYRAGFNSASHFSRAFRERYGVSPLAFRQRDAN